MGLMLFAADRVWEWGEGEALPPPPTRTTGSGYLIRANRPGSQIGGPGSETEDTRSITDTMREVDRFEANRLQAHIDGLTDPEEVRHTATSTAFGPIYDQLRSIVEQLGVLADALDSIGEWDDEEEK